MHIQKLLLTLNHCLESIDSTILLYKNVACQAAPGLLTLAAKAAEKKVAVQGSNFAAATMNDSWAWWAPEHEVLRSPCFMGHSRDDWALFL